MGSAPKRGGVVATLTAVNVGMPKGVPWHGKTVYTGVYKQTVAGPRMVRRLNIDGDGREIWAGTAVSSGRCWSTSSTPTAPGRTSWGAMT